MDRIDYLMEIDTLLEDATINLSDYELERMLIRLNKMVNVRLKRETERCCNCMKLKFIDGRYKCGEQEVQNIKRQDLLWIKDIYNSSCEYYQESF